jgi:outer membrane protein OmpA-like peptidoglycan-associated protein
MKLKITACALAMAGLFGCGTQQPISNYRFDYNMIESTKGVIRAFDDGHKTIVQFVDVQKAKPRFVTDKGDPVDYDVQGQYAVLPMIVPRFTVSTIAGMAMFNYVGIKKEQLLADEKPLGTIDKAVGWTEPANTVGANLERAVAPIDNNDEAAELVRVKTLLEQAKQDLASVNQELQAARAARMTVDHAAIEKRLNTEVMVTTVQVQFPLSGKAFEPNTKAAIELLAAASVADKIMVTGHADNTGDVSKNDALALARALSTKAYLVKHGIASAKITTVSKGDKQPVADNSTPEGRAQNRRVVIVFEGVKTALQEVTVSLGLI